MRGKGGRKRGGRDEREDKKTKRVKNQNSKMATMAGFYRNEKLRGREAHKLGKFRVKY